jgi:hypothetical protein
MSHKNRSAPLVQPFKSQPHRPAYSNTKCLLTPIRTDRAGVSTRFSRLQPQKQALLSQPGARKSDRASATHSATGCRKSCVSPSRDGDIITLAVMLPDGKLLVRDSSPLDFACLLVCEPESRRVLPAPPVDASVRVYSNFGSLNIERSTGCLSKSTATTLSGSSNGPLLRAGLSHAFVRPPPKVKDVSIDGTSPVNSREVCPNDVRQNNNEARDHCTTTRYNTNLFHDGILRFAGVHGLCTNMWTFVLPRASA